MIIVSQDKDTIVNFDNVAYIDIVGDASIFANTYEANLLIGKYETKERAKEVLQKINQKYESSEAKIGKTLITFEKYDFVYEMPKE